MKLPYLAGSRVSPSTVRSAWTVRLAAAVALAVTPACDDDDDGGDDGNTMTTQGMTTGMTTGSEPECSGDNDCADGEMCSSGSCVDAFWAVGGDGSVLRIAGDGTAEPHPPMDQGLGAIECNGSTDAWVVGDGGFVARTTDGGARWVELASTVSGDLRDVEADHGSLVTAVGVDGTWIVGDDAGIRRVSGASGSLEGVGLGAAGLLAVASDGKVWSAEPIAAVAVEVATLDGAPLAIDLAHDVARGVVVGRAGALWWSDDGVSWQTRASGTRVDLHAVQIARDGRAAVAVGDDGVVVHVDAEAVTLVSLEGAGDLRDVHLDWQGHGAAVGAGGLVALTRDTAQHFVVVHPTTSDLVGVDALGPEHW